MAKFNEFRDEGIALKEQGHLTRAVALYKTALDHAETKEDMIQIWNLIVHIHTDRMIASCEKIAELYECDINALDWNWGTHKVPSNYKKPLEEEILI